jgi:hypothetical protein
LSTQFHVVEFHGFIFHSNPSGSLIHDHARLQTLRYAKLFRSRDQDTPGDVREDILRTGIAALNRA